jgi:formylglycine-generating enzyme required for sulfatase activity
LSEVFDRVREQVDEASGHKQTPWTASSVIGPFVFRDSAQERAELERELADLQARMAATGAQAERQRAENQRAAERLRARLEGLRAPASPGSDDGTAARTALEKLRRQRDQARTRLESSEGQAMGLVQARQEVAALERSIQEARVQVDAARDAALRALPAELRAEKDPFETTAQYEARRRKAEAVQAEIESRYVEEFQSAAQPYRARIAELNAWTYPMDQAPKAEFVAYDADAGRLTAKVGGEEHWFQVPPEKARAMAAQIAEARVERALADNGPLWLIDPATGEKFAGARAARANPKDGLKYVWIPPGTFTMGCSKGDNECGGDESPAHEVTISKGFWLGQTEVTQEAYKRITGKNPSRFDGLRLPVERVSWNEAQAYCGAVGMRLPTEAEWEYAARGGSTAPLYGPLDSVAWYDGNSGQTTHKVGQKQANGFGLYDMLGNVWEWQSSMMLRGGSWYNTPRMVRVSSRDMHLPFYGGDGIGFRCAGE